MENNILSQCSVCFENNLKNYIITECCHSICVSCLCNIFYNKKCYECVICRKSIYKKDLTSQIKPIKYYITYDYEDFMVEILTNNIKFLKVKLYFHVKMKHIEFFSSNLRRTEMIYNRLYEELEIYVKKIISNWNYEIKNFQNLLNDEDSNNSDESDEDNNLKIIFNESQKSNNGEIFIFKKDSNYNNFEIIVY